MLRQRTATPATIFSEVLANLAFMFTDEDIPAPAPGDPWLETIIEYRGSVCGTLTFLCTRGFARLLAANLLAIDPQDPAADTKAEDAAREFMNIVCGQLVTTLHGAERMFDLSIPRSTPLNPLQTSRPFRIPMAARCPWRASRATDTRFRSTESRLLRGGTWGKSIPPSTSAT